MMNVFSFLVIQEYIIYSTKTIRVILGVKGRSLHAPIRAWS